MRARKTKQTYILLSPYSWLTLVFISDEVVVEVVIRRVEWYIRSSENQTDGVRSRTSMPLVTLLLTIKWKLRCRSRKQKLKNKIRPPQCSIPGLAISWFFRFCFRLRKPSFHWIISDGVVQRIGRNANVLILPTFDFHLIVSSLTTPTRSLVKSSLYDVLDGNKPKDL